MSSARGRQTLDRAFLSQTLTSRLEPPRGAYLSVSNIGYIWSFEEGADESWIVLDDEQVGLDAILKTLTLDERTFRGPGALHIVPHQFVRVQFGRIAGQEVQFQFAAGRFDVAV